LNLFVIFENNKQLAMDKNNIYEWIVKIIQTCNNNFHFEAVDKLIELFYEKENDEQLKVELQILRQQKWNEIHNILT
jgi:hypothetical protein